MKRLVLVLALALAGAACDDPPPPKRVHFTPMTAPDAGPPPEVDAGPPDAGYVFRAERRPLHPLDETLYKSYIAFAHEALVLRLPLSSEVMAASRSHPMGDPATVALANQLNDRWLVIQDGLLVKYGLTTEEIDLMGRFTYDVTQASIMDQQMSTMVAGRAEYNGLPQALRDSMHAQELANNKAMRDLQLWKKLEQTYGSVALEVGRRHRIELRKLTSDTVLMAAGVNPSDGQPYKPPR